MRKASRIEGDWLNEEDTAPRGFPLPKQQPALNTARLQAFAAAKALTDEKLAALALYQKTMHDQMVAARAKWEASGAKPNMADPKQRSEAERQFKDAQAQALTKSGLSPDEVQPLLSVLGEYYGQRCMQFMAERELPVIRGRMEAANKAGQAMSPADAGLAQSLAGQIKALQAAIDRFKARYGGEVLELLRRHEPTFLPLQERMMKTMRPGGGGKGPLPPAPPYRGPPPSR
jgi:hypothetical protein